LITKKEIEVLKEAFHNVCKTFCEDSKLIDSLWAEILNSYSQPHRFYHTLSHLSFMYTALKKYDFDIDNLDAIIFALFYHDIVYNPRKNDNEEKSALIAENRLSRLSVPREFSVNVSAMILKTKDHDDAPTMDGNLFLDADLAILGSGVSQYRIYAQSIRKEYIVYPDFLYKPGRLKLIDHFLKMPYIFKTPFFRTNFEMAARTNLKMEAESLR
jgi:predicted metal-dependent HD superfamily phosphohydrolase